MASVVRVVVGCVLCAVVCVCGFVNSFKSSFLFSVVLFYLWFACCLLSVFHILICLVSVAFHLSLGSTEWWLTEKSSQSSKSRPSVLILALGEG